MQGRLTACFVGQVSAYTVRPVTPSRHAANVTVCFKQKTARRPSPLRCAVACCAKPGDGPSSQNYTKATSDGAQPGLLEQANGHLKQAKKLYADGQQMVTHKRTQEGYDLWGSAKQQAHIALEKLEDKTLEDLRVTTEAQKANSKLMADAERDIVRKVQLIAGCTAFVWSAAVNAVRAGALVAVVAGVSTIATSLEATSDLINTLPLSSIDSWFMMVYVVVVASADTAKTLRSGTKTITNHLRREDREVEKSIGSDTDGMSDDDAELDQVAEDEVDEAMDEMENFCDVLFSNMEAIKGEVQLQSTKQNKQS